MQEKIICQGLLFLTIPALLAACTTKAADDPKAAGATAQQKLPVDVKVVSARTLDQFEVLAGSILPNREVMVMSEVSRKVVSLAFRDGDQVRAGQLLYRLDDADIRARLNQLQHELNLASLNEKRLSELLKTETVRQEEYDQAVTRLQTLQATKALLQVELSKTLIRAPFSGKLGISRVQAGALVTPGLPLVALQEQHQLRVQFSVPEKYLPFVKKGSTIRFTTELNAAPQEATIFATEPGVDPQSRNITVQALAANNSGRLKPGLSARVWFRTAGSEEKSMVLPTHALIPGAGGYAVYLVKGGMAKATPVKVGNRSEEEAVISEGLKDGDTVMVSNILRASDGMPVQVVTLNNAP